MRVVRGRLRRRRGRRGRPGDDPDRQLDRRPGGRHPPLPARPRACTSSASTSCGSSSTCWASRAPPSTTIRTVHSHVHALGQCRRVIREHGLTPVISGDTAGAAREIAEARRPHPGGDLARRWPRRSTASRCSPRTSRTRTTTPPASWCSPATSSRRPAGNGPVVTTLHLQRPQPARRALQGARRLRDQRRQHDQARELHGRRRVHRHPVPRRGRRPPRGPAACARALEELAFFTTDVKILGVYPAEPFRTE